MTILSIAPLIGYMYILYIYILLALNDEMYGKLLIIRSFYLIFLKRGVCFKFDKISFNSFFFQYK